VAGAGNSGARPARGGRGAAPREAARAGPPGGGTRRVLRFFPRRRAGSRPVIRTRGGQAGSRRNFTPGGFTVSLIICYGYLAQADGHDGQNRSVVFCRRRPGIYACRGKSAGTGYPGADGVPERAATGAGGRAAGRPGTITPAPGGARYRVTRWS